MKNFFQAVLIAAVMFFAACNNPSATDNANATKDITGNDDESVKAHIKKEATKWEEEFRRGDSIAIVAHYASDAIVMPPNSEALKGNDILTYWGGALRMGVKDLKLNITDISGGGDMYAETGTYEMFDADNKSLDKGKYVAVWQKQNGIWKISRDIFNTNLPAAPTK